MRFLSATLVCLLLTGTARAQDVKTASRTTVVGPARVELVDKTGRMLTVRADAGSTYTVYVGPELKVFDDLRIGDTVTVRFVDSVVVAVRPGAKPQVPTDTTAAAQAKGSGRGDVLMQVKVIVTVESVDLAKKLIVYRTADNQTVTRLVENPHLLDGLKRGDVIEVTATRARASEIKKGR